jgi:ABC-2 type transport system permease protein
VFVAGISKVSRGVWTLARSFGEGFALCGHLLRAQIRSQLQYRASFALQTLGQFMATFVGFIALLLLFHRFPTLAGWSLGEVAFLYGLAGIAFGVSDMASSFIQVLASDFQIRRIGRIAQGAVALGLSLLWLEVEWTWLKTLVTLSAIVSGITIFCGIWVMGAAVTFWTVQRSEVTNVFTYGGEELVSHPMPIYADWLRGFFTFVVPLAFVAYLPALYVLDRPDPLGLPPFLQFCSPLVAVAFFLLARGAWSLGVRHYQSTGS